VQASVVSALGKALMLEFLDLSLVTGFHIVIVDGDSEVDDDGEGDYPSSPAASPQPEPSRAFRQHQLNERMTGGGLHQLSVLALATNVPSL
jgi:hypothetical protein